MNSVNGAMAAFGSPTSNRVELNTQQDVDAAVWSSRVKSVVPTIFLTAAAGLYVRADRSLSFSSVAQWGFTYFLSHHSVKIARTVYTALTENSNKEAFAKDLRQAFTNAFNKTAAANGLTPEFTPDNSLTYPESLDNFFAENSVPRRYHLRNYQDLPEKFSELLDTQIRSSLSHQAPKANSSTLFLLTVLDSNNDQSITTIPCFFSDQRFGFVDNNQFFTINTNNPQKMLKDVMADFYATCREVSNKHGVLASIRMDVGKPEQFTRSN